MFRKLQLICKIVGTKQKINEQVSFTEFLLTDIMYIGLGALKM